MADLHLGRRLGEMDLLADQRAALNGILDSARAFGPQVCLIAGDVYDRAVPPAEAVELLSWFLTGLTAIAPVCLIGGNHDSQERLSFARALLQDRGLYIAGRYQGSLERIVLTDAWGPVDIWLMPFFRAREVRPYFPDQPPEGIDQAVRQVLEREKIDFSRRNMLLMHQFVAGKDCQPQVCESESALNAVGGLDAVDVSSLKGFCYTALGHLHAPQSIGGRRVVYAGSPLKYSASEAGHAKGLVAGEMDGEGNVRLERLSIPCLHDVRCVKGTLEQLLSPQAVAGADPQDYLFVTLTDQRMPQSPRERLEGAYPNLVKLLYERPAAHAPGPEAVQGPPPTPYQQFEDFFEKMNGRAMDNLEAAQAKAAFGAVWEGEV